MITLIIRIYIDHLFIFSTTLTWRAFLDFCFNECKAALTHMIIDCLTTLSKFLFYMHKQSAQKIHQETKHLRTKDFIVFE